jgi:sortase A
MGKYYYKGKTRNKKRFLRFLSVGIIILGALIFSYTFFPFISWQIYFAPVFASQKIDAPIPTQRIINTSNIETLLTNVTNSLGTDYTNAYNWYPGMQKATKTATYTISIPKIDIQNALVTNKDMNLSKHLVQYNSDSFPPKEGNSIIFGHSTLPQLYDPTLPQLYDPNNYKTIFANVYKLQIGDIILVNSDNTHYTYKVENITVVDPMDTSVLAQNFSDSFITIITCTPPGTIWKRLIVKARIQNLK